MRVYLLSFVGLIAAEVGFRVGIWLQNRGRKLGKTQMTGAVVGGLLGLTAFLMAFTVGIVLDQHGQRKAIVAAEANAIGTAWLRAGFLDEPDLSTARALLQEYTEIRVAASADPSQFVPTVKRSEEIQNELWAIMEKNVRQGNESDIMGLVIESINDVIDIHALRLFTVNLRLPRLFGIILLAATILSFLLVGIASSADKERDSAATVLFALVFVAVMIVIIDLDRSQEGLLRVSQASMTDLLRQISLPSD
jgi:hypothetical protein